MMRRKLPGALAGLVLTCLAAWAAGRPAGAAEATVAAADKAAAQQLLDRAGVRGGVAVHLGCGDGGLTAALGQAGPLTVHGLDADAARVAAARTHIAALGLYGPVSVERFAGGELPYADNLVNLVVIEDAALAARDEVLRVLAPGGVVCTRNEGGWQKLVRPRPADIDQWSHFLHDAGNNAVARDARVGLPRALQWVAAPLWLRSHETPSGIQGMVSAGGRVFYILDEGLIGITDQRLPERWALLCRDAFNGRLLWRRPLTEWGWPQWAAGRFTGVDWTETRGARTIVPDENQRRLVAEGDWLYATLGYRAPLTILDAATGKVLHTLDDTQPVREILAADGIVLVYSRELPSSDAAAGKGGKAAKKAAKDDTPGRLTAIAGQTGRVLWKKDVPPIAPLFLAMDGGRVVYQAGARLTALAMADGRPLWTADGLPGRGKTLIAHADTVLVYAADSLVAHDAADGKRLWQRDVPPSTGSENPDLFVAGGLVWRGMVPVNDDLKPVGKSADALALGLDLRSGAEKKRIVVRGLRSPEHHHRCYRNKATERYIISGMEGAEFMDLAGDDHGQNNWLRGACKLGIMPCNGLLYVPSDQCFCQPGAKLLGFAAVAAAQPSRDRPVADGQRLERGPAYQAADGERSAAARTEPGDWPTFRGGAARHGSTPTAVPAQLRTAWRTPLGGRLSPPVAAQGKVFVAACDAHTLHALDAQSGRPLWSFVAGGRIDSPPTIYAGLVLFGAADGRVYALRADDGALAWRFLAAPRDCRIGGFEQLESAWPVHGSVLVYDGLAYATAGRSTYLDGGIRVYALDPHTGAVRHQTTLLGPVPDVKAGRDLAFYVPGANSDVLVAEGGFIYMRQKKLSPELRPVECPVLSSKGEADVGLHVFSTAGLLDDTWYNRTFWMYAKRWPGFQLANQSPKSGQLLVVDDETTYCVHPFYRRNVHSPMFFPGKEGYLLFADRNTTEPQIVGEAGARKPLAWLPQSHIPREGNPGLESPAFGLDKMIGYTRADPPRWTAWAAIRVRAMVKAGETLFVAGPPDVLEADDPYAAFEGRRGARLAALSARDGAALSERELASPPVFDGLIAAAGQLFAALEDGSLLCLRGPQ